MQYSLFLEHDEGISLQVGHVNLLSILDDFGMLPGHQPADVGEEEAAIRVVRIRVRVRVFVVLPMVAHPNPEAILSGQSVHVEEEGAHPEVGFEGAMGPEAMRSHRDSLARGVDEPEC